jgi:hypothetical protein
MASADMCEHEWPGTGCEECKAEARERAQQTEQQADNSYHSREFAKAQAKPAPARDERNPTPDDYLAARSALESCDWSNVPLGTKAILGHVVDLLWLAAQARPAQTEQTDRDAKRWQKCKTMPKSWWLGAMAEAGRKGGRSLDESIDAALSTQGAPNDPAA